MEQRTRAPAYWGVGFRVDGDVVVDGHVVALDPVERALLDALCEAPGRFRSLAHLAARAGLRAEDVHGAVAALRAKLGCAAHHVEARGRGYALWAGPD